MWSWTRRGNNNPRENSCTATCPIITQTIRVRRTRHTGHCWRSKDELISDVLLWKPAHGHASVGRPTKTYIDQLCVDTGCCIEDLPRMMSDIDWWREIVMDICADSATWWWWWHRRGWEQSHEFLLWWYKIKKKNKIMILPIVTQKNKRRVTWLVNF